MIDAVLNLGYARRGLYSGHIFIPRLGDDQSINIELRRMKFKRKPLPKYEYKAVAKSAAGVDVNICQEDDDYLLRVEPAETLEMEW